MIKYPVWLRWVDSLGNAMHWMDAEAAAEARPVTNTTIGFVIDESDDHVTIVQSYGDNDQVHNLLCLPRGCILDLKAL